ncbi:MAG: META domain-containing protein [Lentisphaeria bacterium]|nr:MAG: META domain-containing protein [Lentisphaeria bacterium]
MSPPPLRLPEPRGNSISPLSPARKATGQNRQTPSPSPSLPPEREAGRVSGCAGVNRYFGPVTCDDAAGTIRFGTLGATMMAGPGLEYERAYLKMLSTVDSFSISGGRLLLKSGGNTVAEFTAAK